MFFVFLQSFVTEGETNADKNVMVTANVTVINLHRLSNRFFCQQFLVYTYIVNLRNTTFPWQR